MAQQLNSMRSFASTVLCLALPLSSLKQPSASAGTLYTVRDADDHLIAIDNVTLNLTDIGPLGVPFEFGGLAYDPQSDTLFMVGGDVNKALYRVSRATGEATLIGDHGVGRLFGLDFDSDNGVLYGSQYVGGSGLFVLNTRTGSASRVGDLGGNGFGALAYDAGTDTLIGLEIAAGDLFSVNRTTAAKTLLLDGPFVNDGGLAFDTERQLLWAIDFSGNLYSYDPADGYARSTHLSGLGAHDGLAFVPDPGTSALPGRYNGLVESSGAPAHQSTGPLLLTVTTSGKFTGKLSLGGKRYKFKGQFDPSGSATVVVTPKNQAPPFTLTMQFKVVNSVEQITGSVAGGVTGSLRANRSVFHKRNNPAPPSFVGRFTALFQSTSSAAEIPQGDGYATVKVTPGGAVRLVGHLGDGTKISQGSVLSRAGEWPMYVLLYKKQGFVAGFVRFVQAAGVSDFAGSPNWLKPATSGTLHPGPFATELNLIGSRYTAPAQGIRVLNFDDASPNGRFTASNGNLATPLEHAVTLRADNTITAIDPGAQELKLAIKTRTGLVRGSFLDSGTTRELRGVVFQKQNFASGFFLGSTESGLFRIVKSP